MPADERDLELARDVYDAAKELGRALTAASSSGLIVAIPEYIVNVVEAPRLNRRHSVYTVSSCHVHRDLVISLEDLER